MVFVYKYSVNHQNLFIAIQRNRRWFSYLNEQVDTYNLFTLFNICYLFHILGTYCIYMKHDCPTKIHIGSTRWDDEDTDNKNEKSYYLPAGIYDGNTLIHHCCQDEGYWFNSIELPVDHPFYLLPYKSSDCQRVKWTLSSLEYIVYDTENDDNRDQFSGSHVFTNKFKSLPKIYHCYYEGMIRF